jgi:hypothetical protein
MGLLWTKFLLRINSLRVRPKHGFVEREPVDPARVRRVPSHFAWVDHRVREKLRELMLEEIALLFFLHLSADKNGCSFWADATIAKKLNLKEGDVIQARYGLANKGWILYRFPLYQLLPMGEENGHGRDQGQDGSRQPAQNDTRAVAGRADGDQ